MPKRKEKKIKYLRGTRHCGRGNVKNRRGAGNRGGRGKAGLHKHKWSYTVKYLKDHFGKKGFVRKNRKVLPSINVGEIERYIINGALEKEGETYVFNFKGKILGAGKLSHAVIVRALAFSKKAEEKILSAGGKIEKLA